MVMEVMVSLQSVLTTHYIGKLVLHDAYCLLPSNLIPNTDCILSTAYYPLPATYYLLPTAYYLLPPAYYLLPTAYCLLPPAYYLLPTTYYLLSST